MSEEGESSPQMADEVPPVTPSQQLQQQQQPQQPPVTTSSGTFGTKYLHMLNQGSTSQEPSQEVQVSESPTQQT
jgi:hypothetical protein